MVFRNISGKDMFNLWESNSLRSASLRDGLSLRKVRVGAT